MIVTYIIERAQAILPWNPQHLASVGADLAWNTAASFTTNTNWQFYTGESTMSYLTQMAGLATHNFFSAAVGIVVAIALVRAIKRTSPRTIGNFWVDTTRTMLYILLPGSVIYALLLVAQGFRRTCTLTQSLTHLKDRTQTIAQGPVASQEAIKMLGTNGGGFFNANSAHPFENPTPLTNFLQMLSIFIIPAGLTYTLGRMTGSPGHGWAVFAAMYRPVRCRVRNPVLGRGSSASADSRSRTERHRIPRPAATWRAKRFATASPKARSSPPSPQMPAAAR